VCVRERERERDCVCKYQVNKVSVMVFVQVSWQCSAVDYWHSVSNG
jgi:hypothetical protein